MNANKKERRKNPPPEQDEPPPFLGTWNRVYIAIVLYTCALILALHFMTGSLNR
jgi:hypothetical protein